MNIHPRSPEDPGTSTYCVWLDSYYVSPATGFNDEAIHTLHPGDRFVMNGECTNYGPFVIPAGSKFATVFTSFYDGTSVPSNIVELTSDLEIYRSFDSNTKTVPDGLHDGLYSLDNDFHISPSGWGHSIFPPYSTRYCALVKNNGSDIRFIECICTPGIEACYIPDNIDLNSATVLHAALRNSISRNLARPVRAELIQDGQVKGWSSWVKAAFGPEETIDLVITTDTWTWKDNDISHSGDYVLCLSMYNSYGDIWIPMGHGKKVTVTDSAGIDAVRAEDICHDAIYDLYGRKVADKAGNLSSGIYIRLHNGTVTKVISRFSSH